MNIIGRSFLARLAIPILAWAGLTSGCATPAVWTAMVPETTVNENNHPYSIAIEVTGGRATESTGTPQVSNGAFRQALSETLTKSRLFAQVIEDRVADYRLEVIIFDIEQPPPGNPEDRLTVTMEAGWTLTHKDTGEATWQKVIRSNYTASMRAALTYIFRLRLATEGAAKENISAGVTELSGLEL